MRCVYLRGLTALAVMVMAVAPNFIRAAQPGAVQTRTIKIAAPSMEYDWGKNLYLATGGAKLTSKDMTMTSSQMAITMNEKGDDILKMEAEGKVDLKMTYVGKDQRESQIDAQADKALYLPPEKKLTLTGHARVNMVQPSTKRTAFLTGSKVTVWMKENRLRSENAEVEITTPEKQPEKKPAEE